VGRLLGGSGVGVGWEVGAAGSVGESRHMRDPCEKQLRKAKRSLASKQRVNKLGWLSNAM